MAGVRIYQLAKELKVQSALILEFLDRMGREVKSDLSSLDTETAEVVRAKLLVAIEHERQRLNEEHRVEALRSAEGRKHVAVEERAGAVIVPSTTGGPVERTLMQAPALIPGLAEAAGAAESSQDPETLSQPTAAREAPAPRVFAARRLVPHPSVKRAGSPSAGAGVGMTRAGISQRPEIGRAQPPSRQLAPTPAVRWPTPPGQTVPPPRPGVVPGQPGRPLAPPGQPSRPGGPATRPAGPGHLQRQSRRKGKADEAPPPVLARAKLDLPPVPEKITLSEAVTVKELAEKLNRKSKDVIAKLLSRGVLANINQPLDPSVAIELAKDFGSEATVISFEEELRQVAPNVLENLAETEPSEPSEHRPPVVTVMGHVDHGKTSLLDAIRTTNVASTEHGGITQHIGAYQVEERGRKITFLDTPGHEAFTMMRARGARVTDIVVLVVAADDGVRPQTIEAIDHARAADVPIVVAINKIDKPEARPERVKQTLADQGILVEEYGGKTVCCEISAKKRIGIDPLLEMILLVADIQDLKAPIGKLATGVVLEARLDRARGIVATVLVQKGTLKIGDPFIAGTAFGKVRAMVDENGRRVVEAQPSTPVEVMGFASEPAAGDLFQSVAEEAKARQIAAFRQEKVRLAALAQSSRRTLESLSRQIAEGEIKELAILLKSDVQGSLEALQKTLNDLPSDKIRISILRSSTGAITQADVLLASASNAIIVGFNVRPDRVTADLAKQEEVEIRLYSVIYDVVKDIEQAMVGMLEPTLRESIIGQAAVRQTFRVPKVGVVAGCYVTEGRAARNAEVRILRDNVVIYTSKVASLRRFKDDASEVKQGFECGIGIANFNDLKEGDVIEFFVVEKIVAVSL